MKSVESMPAVAAAPMPLAEPDTDQATSTAVLADAAVELPWMCVCWDDPVNLFSYVVYVLQTMLGMSRKRATALTQEIESLGKAVVSTGSRDKVEADVKKLQTAGLHATLQRADSKG